MSMANTSPAKPSAGAKIRRRVADLLFSPGARSAMPVYLLLILGFVAPLIAVVGFSFSAPRTFKAFQTFTLENYATIFDPSNTVWTSFVWSLTLAAATVAILALIAYPIAYGLAHVFGKWASLVSLAFVFPLFVSENIRLYGWVLFFIKGGVLDGTLKTYFDLQAPEFLFTWGATLFGMVYVYLPFMLFPITLGLSSIPKDLTEVARDLGANRFQIWREVELPLAMPGIMIGMLLTFVLAAGAVAESRILGGQAIISITQDIETAFTYAQNWPLGSALAVLLMLVIGTLVLFGMTKLDLDRILGRR